MGDVPLVRGRGLGPEDIPTLGQGSTPHASDVSSVGPQRSGVHVPEIVDTEGDPGVAVIRVCEGKLAVDKCVPKQFHQSTEEDIKETVLQYQEPGLKEGEGEEGVGGKREGRGMGHCCGKYSIIQLQRE